MWPYTPRSDRAKRIHHKWVLCGPSGSRSEFAKDLLTLRKEENTRNALDFRDWMICVGSYPVKTRNP